MSKGKSRQVRHIVEGPLPTGPLAPGRVILAPERGIGKIALLRGVLGVMVCASLRILPTGVAIWRGPQSVRVRLERMNAELLLAGSDLTYSPERLHRMGFREAVCECSPGLGHRRRSG